MGVLRRKRFDLFGDDEGDDESEVGVDILNPDYAPISSAPIIDESSRSRRYRRRSTSSNVDIIDLGDSYEVIIDHPGLRKEHMSLKFEGSELVLEIYSKGSVLIRRVKLPPDAKPSYSIRTVSYTHLTLPTTERV